MKITVAFPVTIEITPAKAQEILDADGVARVLGREHSVVIDRGMSMVCDGQDIFARTMSGDSLPLNIWQKGMIRGLVEQGD